MSDKHPVVEAVTDPDAFFERELPDGRTGVAALIVLAFIAAFAVAIITIGQVLAGTADLSAAEQGALQGALVFGSVFAGIALAVSVVISAGLYHVGTALVDGSGSFKDTFVVTAWGLLPSVLGTLLSAGLFALTFDASVGGSTEAVVARASGYQSSPLAAVVGLGFTLWQIYIVGYGLKHARNVTAKQGLAVAAVISLLGYLFQVL